MVSILKDPLLKLRPMQDSDVDEVMVVENLAYAFPWTAGTVRDSLRVGYCCRVYCLGKRIVGYSIMSIAVGEANILNLCVHPEMQGQGLGRNLLERMLTIARQNNADTAFLEVRASNKAASALYDAMAFNEIGLRRNYYPAKDGREDAVLYAKAI